MERIESLSYNEGKAIYNLNVEDNHTYFVSEEKVCVHNNCMVSSEKVERIFNAIPESTPKDICWNDFQTLMKGEGNSAEKAEAYFKFVGKDSKSIEKIERSTSNSVGKVTEGVSKADLEVKPFNESGKLKPDIKYKAGEYDYLYETDNMGRISKFETDNLQLTNRDSRLPHNTNTPGKLKGDHAGHLAGDRFGGSPELDNLVSQASNVNLSQYKKIENQWAKAIEEGKNVKVNVEVKYDGDSLRPSKFNVQYEIDGEVFSKNILN